MLGGRRHQRAVHQKFRKREKFLFARLPTSLCSAMS
jgi:hypothetical protein